MRRSDTAKTVDPLRIEDGKLHPPFARTLFADDELRLELSEIGAHPVHQAPTYFFRMQNARTGSDVGQINLRVSSTRHVERYAGHIGFGVKPVHRGHRYAARSLRLLLPFARRLGFSALWITCDPENASSRRSLEQAGAKLVEIVDVPQDCILYRRGHTRKCRYRLTLEAAA